MIRIRLSLILLVFFLTFPASAAVIDFDRGLPDDSAKALLGEKTAPSVTEADLFRMAGRACLAAGENIMLRYGFHAGQEAEPHPFFRPYQKLIRSWTE